MEKEKPFESLLEELQKTVRSLESGSLPLEESLLSYERGVALVKSAQHELTKAEKRIEILTQNGVTQKDPS